MWCCRKQYKVRVENIKLKKQVEQLENKAKELENVLDERFIHITGARTVYGRLMQLSKEIIVKDDLKLRNEIKMLLKENKVKEQEESKQDLIRYLEKDIKENLLNEKTNTEGKEEYWRGCKDTEAEILELLKESKEVEEG